MITVAFYDGNKETKSKGPYAYLILGQKLEINDDKSLRTESVYVVGVDMALRLAVDSNHYANEYKMPFDAIYEQDGKKMIDGGYGPGVILNYDYINFNSLENVFCRDSDAQIHCSPFIEDGQLYSVILSFDEKERTCTGVGWDSLGKIVNIHWMTPIEEAFEELVNTTIYAEGIDEKLLTNLGLQNLDIIAKKEITPGSYRQFKIDWESAQFKFINYFEKS